ncbi:hypothetical protein OV090_10550 [Nannocystis sp. RBIL2]|uniref:hypothetical protein n=1 Tax=Nannocystis sp. RBIL2 TaxID=2996788 RepID=UPI00226EC95D|nr:hypothetical protein [Nannocystis sp. RBIL2]MCY1065203.1 hypothetical protein [Nannocystis sp. RBIL2]
MRTRSIDILILGVLAGLGACDSDVPAGTTATTSATSGPDSDSSSEAGTSGEAGTSSSTSDAVPTSGDPSWGSSSSSSSSGDVPPDDCQAPLPSPPSCEPIPEACGNGTAIAGASDAFVYRTALTAEDVWFLGHRVGCPQALYRVSKRGGDAQWIREVPVLVDFEGDDAALYIVEQTEDPLIMKVSARVDGEETVIGETHAHPADNSYWNTALTRTLAGVVTYDDLGPIRPSFAHLTPTKLVLLADKVEGKSLGSAPAYDGERLFFTWNDPPFDEDGSGPLHGALVRLSGGAQTVLAGDASTRIDPSVAVDADFVYFATGDPSKVYGVQPAPMNVSRVAKTGGPVTPLFPAMDIGIDQVLVDGDEVFFHQAPAGIFAVPKTGGTPRHVWHGVEIERRGLHLDAHDLYFSVRVAQGDIPPPGHDFIVRVARTAVVP